MAQRRGFIDSLLLFGLDNRWLDGVLTGVTAAALLATRFGLLACGPWEWDETLFARGILHFELAAHFPHPPGFPGWLAIGHLLLPFAGEPLRALQWGSAALSVIALWPLVVLGRRVAAPSVAVAASVLLMVCPGPWLYSVRGFSSTPAATFALAAAAVAAGGLNRRRTILFTMLIAVALLIRPILLPGLAILWLAVASSVRPRRQLLPGVAAALVTVLLAVLAMVRAEGGWAAFLRPFLAHTDKHFSRLVDQIGGWENVGLVKGLGGGAATLAVVAAAMLGLVVWGHRVGRRSALTWLIVLSVTVAQLVGIQNRSYARYAVPVQLALAPLVASAAALLPPALGSAALIAATGWVGASAYPLVEEQHRKPLPGWRAVEIASRLGMERQMAVVVEPELHPFASYQWHLLERAGLTPPPLVLSPWAPEPWAGVDHPYLVATVHRHHYGASLTGGELEWGGVSAALEPFTQQRFLHAWVIDAPALAVGQWWPVEIGPDGSSFMWGGASCELLLPPLPGGTEVEADYRPAPGPLPLEVLWNGRELTGIDADGGRVRLHVDPELVRGDAANLLSFRRARGFPPGVADPRPISVQVLDLRVRAAVLPWRVRVSSESDRLWFGVRLDGHHQPEHFGPVGEGVWLEPSARLEIPAVAGRLGLTLMAPRPTGPHTVVRIDGRDVTGPIDLGAEPTLVWLPIVGVDDAGGAVTIEVESDGYRPSDHGSSDDRELGVVLTTVRFEPAVAPEWTRPLDNPGR